MSLPTAEPPPTPPHRAALGDRSLFPDLRWPIYANHAAISPPSLAVRAAVAAALEAYATEGVGAFGAWHAQRGRLKGLLADLIGAAPADIGLVPNTTAGLIAVAQCFPWQAGDRVVVFEGEFPTNVTPWQQAAAAFGLEVVTLPVADLARPGGADLGPLEAALRRGARLVAISAVQFQTGLRAPLEAITGLCHAHGAQICVDAIQALGVVPLAVGAVDYLACGGHKWMMGLEGAGFLYARPDRAAALRPRLAGWLSHEQAADFLFEPGRLRYDKPIRPRIDFLEAGAPNSAGYAGLEAGVGLIAQLGVERIFDHVQRWHDAAEAGLIERGFTSLRAPDRARRSGVLGVRPPAPHTVAGLAAALGERGVACTTPDGVLRFAPHWPNALGEVPRLLDAVDDALASA
ncbi:MAG: aminotransferase class V-fold PLP-dependent enzyme [Myxococcales bacterium]|nr:aminotransferase class V-fold PLP-dependent enzyme [Myxococcales bacterium]